MEKTKFDLGQRIWVVRNSKAVEITVNNVCISKRGIEYGESQYNTVPESECFDSKESLLNYVSDGN